MTLAVTVCSNIRYGRTLILFMKVARVSVVTLANTKLLEARQRTSAAAGGSRGHYQLHTAIFGS